MLYPGRQPGFRNRPTIHLNGGGGDDFVAAIDVLRRLRLPGKEFHDSNTRAFAKWQEVLCELSRI
jgi:hypothetical protein